MREQVVQSGYLAVPFNGAAIAAANPSVRLSHGGIMSSEGKIKLSVSVTDSLEVLVPEADRHVAFRA